MCHSNDENTICGQRYSHLIQAGTRFTFGPQCRTSVQDHIIRNRLTPLKWRKNFDELLEAMHLTQHGAHIVDLMRTKVETGLRARIRYMVNGGLIKEEVRNGDTKYTWRADADNFLGLQGWWKDWSPATSRRLAREVQTNKETSSAAASKPPKDKASTQKQKQYLNGNHVLGGRIGSNAIAGVGRDVNLRQTIYVYRRDDSSSSSSSSHDGDILIYEDFASEDGDSHDSSDDDEIPVAKAKDHDIVMMNAPQTQQSTSAFLTQPFQYQQFINKGNHSCNHHQQPQNHVVPEFPPRPTPPAGTPSSSPSFVSDLHTTSPPAPISLSSDLILLPPTTISSDPAPPSVVASGSCSISPGESASDIDLPPRDGVPLRTSINRRAIRAALQDWTEEQLLQAIDQLGSALTEDMILRLKVLGGPDDPAWLA